MVTGLVTLTMYIINQNGSAGQCEYRCYHLVCVYWMTIWDAGWLLYVSAINITSGHSADCPCLTWGKALPGAAPCHPAASLQHRHWSYAGTYDHSLRIPEWDAQFLDICVIVNCIIYSLIFSLAHMSCSIKSWKCMLMWHWQFQNLNESCAAISYVHHLIRFHLSRFLLNPNVRMCSLHWALCWVQCMCWQEFADNNLQISTH